MAELRFHVYKHSGDPEGGLLEDNSLRTTEGFASPEEAFNATRTLFPSMHLLLLRGRYSGIVVAMRRPGASNWDTVGDALNDEWYFDVGGLRP